MTRGAAKPVARQPAKTRAREPQFGASEVEERIDLNRALYQPHPREERQDARTEFLRMPPCAVEAEQAVLGAIMLANESYATARSILSSEDFYRRDHQLIFRAIDSSFERDIPFDAVTLGAWFEEQGLEEEVAGGAYLVELASTTPSAANMLAYAQIVRDKALMRRMIEAGTQIVNNAFEPAGRDGQELLSIAVTSLEKCEAAKEVSGVTVRDGINHLWSDIERRYADEHAITGVPTPYPDMGRMIDCFEPERLYIIAGRTKMGKSIMLGDIAAYAGSNGFHVGVWSIEMGEIELHRRWLASTSGVEYLKLKKPKLLSEEDWEKVQAGTRAIKDASMTTFFDPVVSVERIGAQAAMLKAKGKLGMIVVDYLQIVSSKGGERRDLDIGHVTIGLKNMAKRLGVPVVAGAQINRANEKSGVNVRPPRASDLRESGNIEQDADVVIAIHRPGYYDKRTKGSRVEVLLNRDGETGIFRLEEDFARSRFLPSPWPWEDAGFSGGEQSGFD